MKLSNGDPHRMKPSPARTDQTATRVLSPGCQGVCGAATHAGELASSNVDKGSTKGPSWWGGQFKKADLSLGLGFGSYHRTGTSFTVGPKMQSNLVEGPFCVSVLVSFCY
jgi:hypothetical protein